MAKIIFWYEYWDKTKIQKNNLEKYLFKLMNTVFFGKTIKKMFEYIYTLHLEQHKKIFHRKIPGHRNGKTKIHMNKPVYLGLSVLEWVKI